MPIHLTVLYRTLALITTVSLAAPQPALSQEAATSTSESAQQEAIRPLLWLVGDWEGEGWIRRGPGPPSTFTVHEHAEAALADRLLVVEGIGRAAGEGEDAGRIVHHAFGVLSWDADRGDYRFSTYRADDNGVDARATVEEGVVTWGFETPNGQVRYRFRQTPEGAWHEAGEFSPDKGVTWMPFFEMTLHRVAARSSGNGAADR